MYNSKSKGYSLQLLQNNITQTLDEHYLLETLNLDDKTVLELGCGAASMTKKMASTGKNRKIIATEVDAKQHQKNLKLNINNIQFIECGAQNIPLENNSIDMVCMFKSFHHIPHHLMNQALYEIKRVLKTNGLLYISEPLFQGEQNDLISLFHDEERVRQEAFNAIEDFVQKEEMKLFKELFFQTPIQYNSFEDFQKKQMNLSFNEDNNSKEVIQKVQKAYEGFANDEGKTSFMKPFRVDILQKI